MFDPAARPPLDVHDAVCRARQTLRGASAQVVALTRQAAVGSCEPADLVGSLDRLRGQLGLVDEIADGAGTDVVLDVRPASRRADSGGRPES
jgi:hypothetical protein